MPVIAIGVAVAADVVAGAAVAATAGGIAAISAVTAFEVVAAVGATVAAVGAVTRDKTLTMVGGAIGIIGGIGGLAASAGVLGATAAGDAPIFGPAPAAATGSETGASFAEGLTPATAGTAGGAIDATSTLNAAQDAASANTIPFIADGLPAGQTDIQTFSSIADKATDPAATLASSSNPTAALAGGTTPTGAIDPSTGLPTSTGAGGAIGPNGTAQSLLNGSVPPPATASTDLINTPPPPPGMLGATSPETGQTITSAVDPATGKIISMPEDNSSIFGKIMGWAQKNPLLASGVAQVGGKLLEGMTSTVTPAQVNALNAQAAANNAAAALANEQTRNLSMPKAVAYSTPVSGTPGPIVPPPASGGQPGGIGVINQAPPPRVTGTV